MSDNEENAYEDEGFDFSYLRLYKYVVFCIDYTNADTSKSCLTMISDMIEWIKEDSKSSYSIILLGGKDEPINILLHSKDDLDDGIKKIKSYIGESSIYEGPLPLKEGLEKAVEVAVKNAVKNQQKIIVLMSDTEKPKLIPADSEDIMTWNYIDDFRMNEITLILSPLSQKDLTGSDFYSSLLSLTDQSELIDDREHIAECLSSYGKTNKVELYYDDSNFIVFQTEKLFGEKKSIAKPVVEYNTDRRTSDGVKDEPMGLSYKEYYIPDKDVDTPITTHVKKKNLMKVFKLGDDEGIFSMQELKQLDENVSRKPGRKSRSLELLYVANQRIFEPFYMFSGPSQMLTSKKDDPKSSALSYYFWEHLEKRKQLLVCLFATKKARIAYVRPITFKGERCFIMTSVGYLEDFSKINQKTYCTEIVPDEDYDELVVVQQRIVDSLRTHISTLDVKDPRAVHLNALFEAKRNNKPLDHATFVDETSKDFHDVRRKVRDLVKDFNVLTFRKYPEVIEKPKRVKRKREEC